MAIPPELEVTVRAMSVLRPRDQELVSNLVLELAAREGFDSEKAGCSCLKSPVFGLDLWKAKMKQEGSSCSTISTYASTLRALLTEHPEPTKLILQRWLARRVEERSSSAASTDLKAMRSLFSFLFEEGLWPCDPTIGLKPIKVRYTPKDAPMTESVQLLMSHRCRDAGDTERFQLMTLLLASTGLRISEACGLRKDKIFIGRRELVVNGKGGKVGVVPLLQVTADAISAYIERHPTPSPFLFESSYSKTGHWSKNCYEKTFREACKQLGIINTTPHSLRHFFATVMLKSGAKLEVVSRILRHSSIGTTGDIYRTVLTEEMHLELGNHGSRLLEAK